MCLTLFIFFELLTAKREFSENSFEEVIVKIDS